MFCVYILKSLKDGKLYIGCTSNIQERFRSHNLGRNKSTKWRRPLKLIYSELYASLPEARKREWYFKNTSEGNIWLKNTLKKI